MKKAILCCLAGRMLATIIFRLILFVDRQNGRKAERIRLKEINEMYELWESSEDLEVLN